PLWKNLGTYSHPITTISPRSQAYFDQGLRLTYGFNHAEAQRSFREAARVDPSCAMCQWGIAITYGSNYNDPTNPDRERAALDRGYADAMRDVAQRFPDDLEAGTFYADAMMNLRPWNLWTPEGQP